MTFIYTDETNLCKDNLEVYG